MIIVRSIVVGCSGAIIMHLAILTFLSHIIGTRTKSCTDIEKPKDRARNRYQTFILEPVCHFKRMPLDELDTGHPSRRLIFGSFSNRYLG